MPKVDLAYEFISSGKYLVIYCHGLPSAKSSAKFHVEAFRRFNLKCISFDRPGFGDSTLGESNDLFDDARYVLDTISGLGVSKFAVIGVSCGGPLASAIAYLAQDRCKFLGLLAAMPPGAYVDSSHNSNRLPFLRHVFKSARNKGFLAKIFFNCDAFFLRKSPKIAMMIIESMLCDSDRKLLQDKEFRNTFIDALVEGYKQGAQGAIHDAYRVTVCSSDFLQKITCSTVYYRATLDRYVTPLMSSVYLSGISQMKVRDYFKSGHVSIIRDAELDMFKDICEAMW